MPVALLVEEVQGAPNVRFVSKCEDRFVLVSDRLHEPRSFAVTSVMHLKSKDFLCINVFNQSLIAPCCVNHRDGRTLLGSVLVSPKHDLVLVDIGSV
jgi:hypothetical protein